MTARNLMGEFMRGITLADAEKGRLLAVVCTGIANGAVFIIQTNKCTTYIYFQYFVFRKFYVFQWIHIIIRESYPSALRVHRNV